MFFVQILNDVKVGLQFSVHPGPDGLLVHQIFLIDDGISVLEIDQGRNRGHLDFWDLVDINSQELDVFPQEVSLDFVQPIDDLLSYFIHRFVYERNQN